MEEIRCKTCEQGTMIRKKKYRLSGPAVVIGYIFLIPSFLGIILGALIILLGAGSAATIDSESAIRNAMIEKNIPAPIIQKIIDGKQITTQEKEGLTKEQKLTINNIHSAKLAVGMAKGGAVAVSLGIGIFFIVVSFIGGLLGWILTMKKKVLQCTNCQAVVNAS